MTQKDKDLLFKDLCARLPYGVKVLYENKVLNIDYISAIYEEIKLDNHNNYTIDISDVKPYLFPLSSMTEEQKKEYYDKYCLSDYYALEKFDWFNENHLDYRGLIPKGIANDATGKNIY